MRALLVELGISVVVNNQHIEASIDSSLLGQRLGFTTLVSGDEGGRLLLPIMVIASEPARGLRLSIEPKAAGAPAHRDGHLVALILRARAAQRQIIDGGGSSEQAEASASVRHLSRLARLSYLAPDIVTAILEGRQPPTLKARRLSRIPELPASWPEQRRMLGFG